MEENKYEEKAGEKTIIKIHSKDIIMDKVSELMEAIKYYDREYRTYLMLSNCIYYVLHILNCSLCCSIIAVIMGGSQQNACLVIGATTTALNMFSQGLSVHEKKNEFGIKLDKLRCVKKICDKKLMVGIQSDEEKIKLYDWLCDEII